MNSASQGVAILLTYLVGQLSLVTSSFQSSMVMHIAMGYLIPHEGTLKMYMNGLKDLLEALPQLVVPISTVVFSKEVCSSQKMEAEDTFRCSDWFVPPCACLRNLGVPLPPSQLEVSPVETRNRSVFVQ